MKRPSLQSLTTSKKKTKNHLFYYVGRDCRTPLLCEILLAVVTRHTNPFEGQLGSYRWFGGGATI